MALRACERLGARRTALPRLRGVAPAGLGESWQFTLKGRGQPTEEMLTYLRLIQLQGTDSFLLEVLPPPSTLRVSPNLYLYYLYHY